MQSDLKIGRMISVGPTSGSRDNTPRSSYARVESVAVRRIAAHPQRH